jgi:hypothetical protein
MDVEAKISELLDDYDFQLLDRAMGRFNLFEAVGLVRAELRHSNFLGFLLSPSRTHGFGASLLRRLLREILSKMADDQRPVRRLQLVVSDLDDAVVHREWNNLDLMIDISSPLNLVVAIENKIDAQAGEGQLSRYRKIVQERFPNRRHLFVFLTPLGTDPDDGAYVPFSYAELAKLIHDLCDDPTSSGSPEAKTIVRHYVEMLRRHIVPDEDLQRLAQQIYERHKEALDFIFESRPQQNLLGLVSSLLEGQGDLIPDRHSNTLRRFAHASWANVPELNCSPPEAWTRTGRNVLFEVQGWNAGPWADRVIIALYDGPAPGEIRERIYVGAMARPNVFKGIVKPMGRQWARIYLRELLTPAKAANMEMEEKKVAIQTGWETFINEDLPQLVTAVIEIAHATGDSISPNEHEIKTSG